MWSANILCTVHVNNRIPCATQKKAPCWLHYAVELSDQADRLRKGALKIRISAAESSRAIQHLVACTKLPAQTLKLGVE
jgi:hypothetical protein